MVKLDHLTIPVTDYRASRDWYVANLGFTVELEIPEHRTAALQDDAGLTLFLEQVKGPLAPPGCILTVQVDDVEALHGELVARGVPFTHGPRQEDWGYGAELRDLDGYRVRLWDAISMREKGQG